jgi:tRNA uridine 5-carboxymethylaminomethyl modification enzyme
MDFNYDVIVIGGGHAGCEAAAAAANLGSKTLLITMDMNKIAQMSCNPAVGGIAKGQIVREIDALGGYMGIVTDKSSLQFRMLNRSKGPAMWSPRSQCDRNKYTTEWRNILDSIPNLYIWQGTVVELLFDESDKRLVTGVKTEIGIEFKSKTVVLTNGTFLNGLMHFGKVTNSGGRISEPASFSLTEQLVSKGISSDRMKTGTPIRFDIRSIDFNEVEEQKGDFDFNKFSYLNTSNKTLKQLSCWITFTNEECHSILRSNLTDSPLYNGQIKSIGPRYCPSIETKIVTFADKDRHQLFLEPEGEYSNEYYLNGFSSSLPFNVQLKALQSIPAFRNIHIYRPGYAIEYDFFDPTQLFHTLESKIIKNLFFAGQVNGTTGYEEAGAQGLIAGINAHLNSFSGEKFILGRDQAYIGVLIDDLVTKGVDEPYRMFTSRAEYRILLRQDNADSRLTELGFNIGLVSVDRYNFYLAKKNHIDSIINYLNNYSVKPEIINDFLLSKNSATIPHAYKLNEILKRPNITILELYNSLSDFKLFVNNMIINRFDEILEEVEILIKYNGYIEREKLIANKINRLENIAIKGKFDYGNIHTLSTEARQKLININPENIAQASRIPGISPSDINILLVLLGR